MFVLGFYSHDTPVAYVHHPSVSEDVLFALDSLIYSTVPKFKLRIAWLTDGLTALIYTRNHYALVILTDHSNIIGFFKEILYDFWAKLVPYEGQEVEPMLRPYGIRILESIGKAYLYIPRRIDPSLARYYKRAVAETGHESFALAFEDHTIIFNRKGMIFSKATENVSSEDPLAINSLKLLAKKLGKNPKGVIFSTEPRSICSFSFILRARLGRLGS